ncbi:MAG: hypothetical protein OSB10_11055, partial [Planctomycetota bacterium]|nr:hypothetical protein [Planctomycetota bacterium]
MAKKKAKKSPPKGKVQGRTTPFSEHDTKTLNLVESTALRIQREIHRRTLPELKFPVRSLANVTYDKSVGYFQLGS